MVETATPVRPLAPAESSSAPPEATSTVLNALGASAPRQYPLSTVRESKPSKRASDWVATEASELPISTALSVPPPPAISPSIAELVCSVTVSSVASSATAMVPPLLITPAFLRLVLPVAVIAAASVLLAIRPALTMLLTVPEVRSSAPSAPSTLAPSAMETVVPPGGSMNTP